MNWIPIIQRAAYTRFSKTGSLESFQLARRDLLALASEAAGKAIEAPSEGLLRIQVIVPVPTIRDGLSVRVDEWTMERKD